MIESLRLEQAYETARDGLLAACDPSGHWVGRLSSSAFATATAVSALAICERRLATNLSGKRCCRVPEESIGTICGEDFSRLICGGLHFLAEQQNHDGGWGDTPTSGSNIATTAVVIAAFRLTAVPANHADVLERAEEYIASQGGLRAVRRWYGRDRAFAAPVLAVCALAGMISWREVPQLPFELACLSQPMLDRLRLSGLRCALPVLVAVGQARHHHAGSLNLFARAYRRLCRAKSLEVIQRSQPASGGFWESPPLTSFVVMCLASMGQHALPAVRRGVQFLRDSVRPDGSWAVGTNLAVWNTSQAITALAAAGEKVSELDLVPWLLRSQSRGVEGVDPRPGGWSWTDAPESLADADDTAAALLALDRILQADPALEADRVLVQAGLRGVDWLLGCQNEDGGWPSFCRGRGQLPFDRSAADFTATAVRALAAWKQRILNDERAQVPVTPVTEPPRSEQLAQAIERGLSYLTHNQLPEGCWVAARFGDPQHGSTAGEVYGTARVLLVYRDLKGYDCQQARRGVAWLLEQRNADGGWGRTAYQQCSAEPTPQPAGNNPRRSPVTRSTVEETALAVEALLPVAGWSRVESPLRSGLEWLCRALEQRTPQEPAPLGVCLGKFAYSEQLLPLIYSTSALGHALQATSQTSPTQQQMPETTPT